jgi:hypothetical protein
MDGSVTKSAKSYEILRRIIPMPATKVKMMYFEIRSAAASLASPSIPLQHLPAQLFVGGRV